MKKFFFLFLALALLTLLFLRTGMKQFARFSNLESVNNADKEYLDEKAKNLKGIDQAKKEKQSLCGNSYFPLIPGASWKYNLLSSGRENTQEVFITKGENEKYVINTKFDSSDWTSQSEIYCSPVGIILDNLSFFLAPQKIGIVTTPINSQGIFIPQSFGKTTTWNFYLASKNEVVKIKEGENIKEEYLEEASGTFSLGNQEEIETPLGKLSALRLDSVWKIVKIPLSSKNEERENTLSLKGVETKEELDNFINQNRQNSTETVFNLTLWVVDQTGIIKSIYKEKNGNSITLELRSFQIPAL